MRKPRLPSLSLLLLAAALPACGVPPEPLSGPVAERSGAAQPVGQSWPRWGGPNGDFTVAPRELAVAWPAAGPPLVWSRPLGRGYSAISAADGVLFAMHREGEDELVAALRAEDGSTIWEHRYAAPPRRSNQTEFGSGPNASPLVLENRVSGAGKRRKLRKASGKDICVNSDPGVSGESESRIHRFC